MKQVLTEEISYLVLSTVEEIPEGKVATYGQIAKKINRPKYARLVGKILSMSTYFGTYPCHRVVNHKGRIAPHFYNQKQLLQNELVPFKDEFHVDLKKCQW